MASSTGRRASTIERSEVASRGRESLVTASGMSAERTIVPPWLPRLTSSTPAR